MQQIWHITLPGLKAIIAIKLIMSVGSILSSNTDMILLLYNTATQKTADVIGTYVYRLGIQGGKFSYTTAVNLFMSLIGFALTFAPNLATVAASDNSMSGYIALGVTAWSKNPFLGMVVGVLVRYLGVYVGLV